MHNRKNKLNIKKGYKLVSVTRTGKLRSYALSGMDEVAYNSFLLPHGTRFARRVRLLNNITIFKPGA